MKDILGMAITSWTTILRDLWTIKHLGVLVEDDCLVENGKRFLVRVMVEDVKRGDCSESVHVGEELGDNAAHVGRNRWWFSLHRRGIRYADGKGTLGDGGAYDF